MKCIKCGAENIEGAKFCANCGADMAENYNFDLDTINHILNENEELYQIELNKSDDDLKKEMVNYEKELDSNFSADTALRLIAVYRVLDERGVYSKRFLTSYSSPFGQGYRKIYAITYGEEINGKRNIFISDPISVIRKEIITLYNLKKFNELEKIYNYAVEINCTPLITDYALNLNSGSCVEKKDVTKALKLIKKAAELGDPQAMTNLSIWYNDGINVNKDEQKAKQYLLSALKYDYVPAKQLYGCALIQGTIGFGTNDPRIGNLNNDEKKKGVEILKECVEKKRDGNSAFSLGYYYHNGLIDNGDVNLEMAKKYFSLAVELGNENAQKELENVEKKINLSKNFFNTVFWRKKH